MHSVKIKIGMGQLLVEGGEPERNIGRARNMAAEAKALGCDILLLPECLDLAWTHPSCLTEAQPVPGPHSDAMVAIAREHAMHVCCGLVERDGDKIYNTAILIDDHGRLLLKYRKINVLDVAFDMYSIGTSLSVVDTKFGPVGVNICSDNYRDSLDIGSVLGRMGARLILSPSSWTVDYSVTEQTNPYADKWAGPYHTLAELYDLVIVSATSVGTIVGGPYEGKKMVGCSLAVDKNGPLISGGYNEFAGELLVVDVEIPPPGRKGTDVGKHLLSRNACLGFK